MLHSCYKMSDQVPEETTDFWTGDARLTFSTGHHNGSSLVFDLYGI